MIVSMLRTFPLHFVSMFESRAVYKIDDKEAVDNYMLVDLLGEIFTESQD